jgi:DUF4097 and DUF4098 domain-containing protein YvlB
LFDRSGTVDYIVTVPYDCRFAAVELVNGELLIEGLRGKEVHAHLVNGRMLDHNCFSEVHCEVVSGGLDVAYEWWEYRKFSIEGKIANGNLRAFIPGDAAFHLMAATANGKIANEFTEKEHRQRGLVQKVDMIVGSDSGADVRLEAVNGSIKIAEANL